MLTVQKYTWLKNQNLVDFFSRPENSFWTLPQPKNSPLGPPEAKKDVKIRSMLKVGIRWGIENQICSGIWVDPKKVFEHYPNPKNNLLAGVDPGFILSGGGHLKQLEKSWKNVTKSWKNWKKIF